MQTVMDLMQAAGDLAPFFTLRQSYLTLKIVSYETLWAIFVPGSIVVATPFFKTPQLFKVISGPESFAQQHEPQRQLVLCAGYDFDGKDFVKACKSNEGPYREHHLDKSFSKHMQSRLTSFAVPSP